MILTNYQKGLLTLVITLALGFVLGIGTMWKLYRPKLQAKTILAHPEQRQKDGALTLESNPQAAPRAAQAIPDGAKVERTIQAKVEPSKAYVEALARIPGISQEGNGSPTDGKNFQNIPPMTIDLSLLTMKDNSQRVNVSSPDGTVITGIDIPSIRPTYKDLKWAAGGVYRLTQTGKAYGAFIDRDFGPVRTSVEVARSQSDGLYGWEIGVRGGIRW